MNYEPAFKLDFSMLQKIVMSFLLELLKYFRTN